MEPIVIPESEIIITTSRAGGPGGQHVNKANTRITLHWNVAKSNVLSDEQKQRIMEKLGSRLTEAGDIVIHNSSSRSQHHNKTMAMITLQQLVRKALCVPKKRIPTTTTKAAQESRLQAKRHYSRIKELRRKRFNGE